jgi:hypothetical protein
MTAMNTHTGTTKRLPEALSSRLNEKTIVDELFSFQMLINVIGTDRLNIIQGIVIQREKERVDDDISIEKDYHIKATTNPLPVDLTFIISH